MKSSLPLLLLTALAALATSPGSLASGPITAAPPSAKPEESLAALGTGSIEVEVHQVDGAKAAVNFTTDLESVVGATVAIPGQRKTLLSLRARSGESEERPEGANADADVSVGSDSLAGPRLHAIVSIDLSREQVIQLTLLSKSGGSHVIRLHKSSWSDGKVILNLTGTGSCITYRASCSECVGTIEKEYCSGTLDV